MLHVSGSSESAIHTFDYRKIRFGFASAEQEGAQAPELLLEGYLDFRSVTDEAESGSKFLFLGYKGSGKSAIGERLRLIGANDPMRFYQNLHLQDFPFTTFSKIIRGDAEPESKFPDAWSWLILTYVLNSLANDHGVRVGGSSPTALTDTLEALRAMGLCPAPNMKDVVRASAKKSFKLTVPKFLEAQYDPADPKIAYGIPSFVQTLKNVISSIRSDSKHFIIIDGLDDILSTREVQYKSLGSLVFEVSRLNQSFRQTSVPVRIILLCRTDLFERVAGANKNKIRQDSSIELDWFADPRNPKESLLIKLANLRARIGVGKEIDIFERFFPESINGKPIEGYLLDVTRHTPRDFLQLLTRLQRFYVGGKFSEAQIKSGIREYSNRYFLPEIFDEMHGFISESESEAIFRAIEDFGRREFSLSDIKAMPSVSRISRERLEQVFARLFECSAVGHVERSKSGEPKFAFKYRNQLASFVPYKRITVHRGLWKALNLN